MSVVLLFKIWYKLKKLIFCFARTMARPLSQYVCQSCGSVQSKWSGQCQGCGNWNTLSEESANDTLPKGLKSGRGRVIDFVSLEGQSQPMLRHQTGIKEFDRVCGGGLVPGSVLLVGGDPGIGKSTLLLQVVAQVSHQIKSVYISGEEAIDQVRLRARRLGVTQAPVRLAAATNIRNIITSIDKGHDAPDLVIIDSIQTMYVDNLEAAPGTVSQVRASAQELIRVAKKRGICILLVGHVTKEGTIAGPRVLEHMVDAVLYFEGDRGHHFRILRSVKNRFGSCDEIGVFEMTQEGLQEVPNPSALFLAERQGDISGAVVFAGMEGSRPMLVEIQALVSQSSLATPRRAVIGWDANRLAMILAVLESRCGAQLSGKEVYLNVAGGMKITEPAADLAVAAALLSSLADLSLPQNVVVFGEIGLSGEVRPVAQPDARLKESSKLGFSSAWLPSLSSKKSFSLEAPVHLSELKSVKDLLHKFSASSG